MSNPTADKIKAEMDAEMNKGEVPQLGNLRRKPKESKDAQKQGNQIASVMKGFH